LTINEENRLKLKLEQKEERKDWTK